MHLEKLYSIFQKFPGICTDSRNVSPDSLFFAIKGENFDGNAFAAEALGKGASFAIVDDPVVASNEKYILVENTLKTLQNLASYHRISSRVKIIAITGSNGKTTTKELIAKVLNSEFQTMATHANLNNHIGVPLTLLKITENTSFAVVEMGANHPGEIADLCHIAKPDYGIITNIGKAHLEGFGGFEGVVKAKSELYAYIKSVNGVLFVNQDNPLLLQLSEGTSRITYGTNVSADYSGSVARQDPFLEIEWHSGKYSTIIPTQLYGNYNLENILAAVSIGSYFGISPGKINEAIASYVPDNNRSQVIKTGRNVLILDAYNANPSSMKAALVNFQQSAAASRMVILGDMMELGEYSIREHQEIISLTRELAFENVFFIGELFTNSTGEQKDVFFRNIEEASNWFSKHPVFNKTILIKGSRKMKLEMLRDLF